jgi:nucleoside-diphosphate-sugar epimerase
MATILIVGCGSIGIALGNQLATTGHQVVGVKRNVPAANALFDMIAADISQTADIAKLPATIDYLFFIVSADSRQADSYRQVYQIGLNNLLAYYQQQTDKPQWFFVSSTSVYGQQSGEWVDEDSPTAPSQVTSQLIVEAEQRLWANNPKHVVVRFSGIYGPGREYLLNKARQAPTLQHTPPYYTNRIHQDDCVAILAFLLAQHLQGTPLAPCYLASDDNPAPLWEVIVWLAQRMHCAGPSAQTIMNADQNKRCRNSRLKQLGYQFLYPDYQAGYRHMLALRNN